MSQIGPGCSTSDQNSSHSDHSSVGNPIGEMSDYKLILYNCKGHKSHEGNT